MGSRVSVVIPAYRAAHTIGRAVRSVLAQSALAGEVIVVDDGSPDDIAGALASFGDAVTLVRKPNGGVSSARNVGIDRARGDFIAFLDADDRWHEKKIERQLAVFDINPDVGIVGTRFRYETENGADGGLGKRPVVPVDRPISVSGGTAFFAASAFGTSGVVVRRQTLGALRFDETLKTGEDRDMWLRLLLRTSGWLIGDPLVTYVLAADSLSRSNVDSDCRNALALVDRYRDLLGEATHGRLVAQTHAKWAGRLLSVHDGRGALPHALFHLVRAPSPKAGWIVAKSLIAAAVAAAARTSRERT